MMNRLISNPSAKAKTRHSTEKLTISRLGWNDAGEAIAKTILKIQ
jgi:hypothetical protein